MDLTCLPTGSPPTTAMVSWPREYVTPGGGVWVLCESHPICVGQNHVQRETIYSNLRKREEYMWASLDLCLGINALQYHFIEACAYSLFTPARFPIPGTPGDSSGGLSGNYSNSPARAWQEGSRFTWATDCRAHGSGKKPKGSRLLLWSRSSRRSILSETRTAPCLPAQRLLCFHDN